MKGIYKRGGFYCDKCDIGAPEPGVKCTECGVRAVAVKIPKKTTRQILDEYNN